MARLKEPRVTGTFGNVTVYRMWGTLYQRAKSTLSGERVKTDPAFEPTRWYAWVLATSSRIGSQVYSTLTKRQKKQFKYQFLTGKAYKLLKKGMNPNEVQQIMHELYAANRSFISKSFKEIGVVLLPYHEWAESWLGHKLSLANTASGYISDTGPS